MVQKWLSLMLAFLARHVTVTDDQSVTLWGVAFFRSLCYRPAEIMARLSNVMCQLCLAEAQALTAFRAGQRSSSSGPLVASLHAGAAELYEKAAKVIRDYIGRFKVEGSMVSLCMKFGSGRTSVSACDIY
jgi:hypothetical protein